MHQTLRNSFLALTGLEVAEEVAQLDAGFSPYLQAQKLSFLGMQSLEWSALQLFF
jgi:hypothetical protein